MASKSPSEASVIVASEQVVSCELGGGAALLDLKSSTYFGLNEVGSEIWALIQKPKQLGEIRDALLARYDVEPARCLDDLIALVTQLAGAGLIRVTDANAR
jgi:hypothetical protein